MTSRKMKTNCSGHISHIEIIGGPVTVIQEIIEGLVTGVQTVKFVCYPADRILLTALREK
jgi:hypothetical protein